MKRINLRLSFIVLLFCLLFLPLSSYGVTKPINIAGGQKVVQGATVDSNPVQTDEVVLPESEPEVEVNGLSGGKPQNRSAFMSRWLHILDGKGSGGAEGSSVIAFGSQVPGDLAHILKKTGGDKGFVGFLGVLMRSVFAIIAGFFVIFLVRKAVQRQLDQLEQVTPPGVGTFTLIWVGIFRKIPAILSLLVLMISATLVFLVLAGGVTIEGRMLFLAILGSAIIVMVSSIVSEIIFEPEKKELRPFELSDLLAKPFCNALFASLVVLLSGFLLVHFIKELGAQRQTVVWTIICLGSTVMAFYGYLVIYLKKPVSQSLLTTSKKENGSWLQEQFANYWHIPALLYLFIVWFIWIGQELAGAAMRNGSFTISMFIVPIYLVLSHVGRVLIAAVVESLGLGKTEKIDPLGGDEEAECEEEIAARRDAITSKAHSMYRIFLVAVLTTWIMSLWGYDLPFATIAVRAIFESLVTLALALACWRFASSYIERKIEEATPEVEEKQEDSDDEFGGAVLRGRSHTLLPMLRKVIGTVLVVMVTLIVISSLGVNIGPLLAGAGVLGLAIGFGAQKLVSDIFSGFFFLLDDAFRVGEYIEAGSIRGTVESITLRNVMLRHHLGMLQVVPHSDLGAVTNYMRGGLVIKFPLEFSYDTDIDKVRKIIKKVGQAMLADEEMGDDFILPVKSQGVYEITNSVMVIRVKFTAKPGKQFLIKREAFRRITEALNAKGIYYAHRKVIVDFPAEHQNAIMNDETKRKALEAGAAAIATQDEQGEKVIEEKGGMG